MQVGTCIELASCGIVMQVLTRMMRAMNEPTHLTLAVDDENARARFDGRRSTSCSTRTVPAPRLIVALDGEALPAPTRRRRWSPGCAGCAKSAARSPSSRDPGAARRAGAPRTRPRLRLAARSRSRRRAARRRRWVPRVAAAALAALVSSPAACRRKAAVAPTPTRPIRPRSSRASIERNPNLASFQGRLHVDIRLSSFPFIREHLDATTYYQAPVELRGRLRQAAVVRARFREALHRRRRSVELGEALRHHARRRRDVREPSRHRADAWCSACAA